MIYWVSCTWYYNTSKIIFQITSTLLWSFLAKSRDTFDQIICLLIKNLLPLYFLFFPLSVKSKDYKIGSFLTWRDTHILRFQSTSLPQNWLALILWWIPTLIMTLIITGDERAVSRVSWSACLLHDSKIKYWTVGILSRLAVFLFLFWAKISVIFVYGDSFVVIFWHIKWNCAFSF